MSKREQNKLANRNSIINAARNVFCDVGYDAASINDVIVASGLSVGTFYNYFGDKQSLITLLFDELLGNIRTAVHEARNSASDPEQFIHGAFLAFIKVLRNEPQNLELLRKNTQVFRQAIFDGEQLQSIFAELEADMQSAIDAKLLPAFPTRLMTSSMIGATIEVFSTHAEQDADELATFLSQLFIGGIQRIGQNTQA